MKNRTTFTAVSFFVIFAQLGYSALAGTVLPVSCNLDSGWVGSSRQYLPTFHSGLLTLNSIDGTFDLSSTYFGSGKPSLNLATTGRFRVLSDQSTELELLAEHTVLTDVEKGTKSRDDFPRTLGVLSLQGKTGIMNSGLNLNLYGSALYVQDIGGMSIAVSCQ